MAQDGEVYGIKGNRASQQAEPSTAQRGGGTLDIRILVELQVISMLLVEAYDSKQDLPQLRQDIADSIT